MMEKRYLELTARGLKIGSNIPIRLSLPAAPLRCGDEAQFELELELPEGMGASLELEPTEATGLRLVEGQLRAVQRTSGSAIVHVPMHLVLEGSPGPTLFEVVLKEGDFRATLGKVVDELTVLPPVFLVTSTKREKTLDPINGGTVELVLSKYGSERSRCELEVDLVDGSGSKVPLKGPTRKDLTLKGELRTVIEVVPAERLSEGIYSLDATVVHGGIKDRTTIRDLFRIEGEIIDLEKAAIEEHAANVMIKRFEAHPGSVIPGGTVTITLECEVPDTLRDAIKPVLRLGRTTPVPIEMPSLDASGLSRSLFVPGPDMPGGDIPCELTLMDGDRTLLRDVRPRFLFMERSSKMEVLIRTPLDLTERGKGPLSGLLLPGEAPVQKGTTGELTVWTLNTGRSIMAIRDHVLGRENDPPQDRDEARGLYVLHCTRKAFMEPGVLLGLKEGMDHENRLLDALERANPPPEGGRKVTSGTTGWTAAAIQMGQATPTTSKMERVEDTQIRELRSVLTSLFSGTRNDPATTHASEPLRAFLERSVSGLRTSGARPGRDETLRALRRLSGICSSSLQLLMNAKDTVTLVRVAVDLLLAMVLERLVKLEVLTAWDDPAVSTWDDLRTERQRLVKHGISGLLEVPNRLTDLERTAHTRFDACMRNMVRRWSIASMISLKGVPGSLTMTGTGGTVWERKLEISLGPNDPPLEIRPYLHLPGRSWQLLSPRSERRGELLDLGPSRADGQTPLEIVLKVQPPRSPPSDVKGLLYLIPDHFTMEEEP